MKIDIINPDSGMTREELSQRVALLKRCARADTELTMECPRKNNICVDSLLDVALDAPEIIEMAQRAEQNGFDAVGLYCFSDPGIAACRECLSIPVIGGGQAAILTAACLGDSFSILTTSQRRVSQKKEFVRASGVDYTRLASVRSVELPVEEAGRDPDETIRRLTVSAARCVEQDGADVVILGCLSFAGLAPTVSAAVGVPVVDPAFSLVNMAELAVAQGLSQSKRSYPFPPGRGRHIGAGDYADDNRATR